MPTKKSLPACRLILIGNQDPETLVLLLAKFDKLPHQTD